ncbi:MAG: 4Fe-4S dicluster domain-containing protein [Candidatus Aminicenantes bacterium]|nr:4Fe-4S dicluster domain-containing protein [Candidatus Aminicenantes bacterium]
MTTKGAAVPAKEGIKKAILGIFKKALETECLDAIMIPVKVPETESYAWVLLNDTSLLESADPLPPVMMIQGGKALSDLTRQGKIKKNIAVVLRPCETRAAVELYKLKQFKSENISLISIDCPGAVPLSNHLDDPKKSEKTFNNALDKWDGDDSLRTICNVCNKFSLPSLLPDDSNTQNQKNAPATDLHIGLSGNIKDDILFIPVTSKGGEILEKLELKPEDSLQKWETKIKTIKKKKDQKRKGFNRDFKAEIGGIEKFLTVFDECINCHNCQSVCPICYCQQCYFETAAIDLSSEDYLRRAKKKGALRFPLDTMLFHLGRMSHMALSCVSCGACEDACPMSIPVSQVFSLVGDQTQQAFNYIPGRNREEPLPLQDYLKDEFCEVETPSECGPTTVSEVKENV